MRYLTLRDVNYRPGIVDISWIYLLFQINVWNNIALKQQSRMYYGP